MLTSVEVELIGDGVAVGFGVFGIEVEFVAGSSAGHFRQSSDGNRVVSVGEQTKYG